MAAFLLIDPHLVADVVGRACLLATLLVRRVRREAPVLGPARSLP